LAHLPSAFAALEVGRLEMKHPSPKVNNPNSVNAGELVGKVLHRAAQQTRNPFVEALFDEMRPEIDGLLRTHLQGHEVDLTQMHNGLNRAGRIVQRLANAQRRATA